MPNLRLPLWNEVLVAISKASDRGRYSENLKRQAVASRSYLTTIVKKLQAHDLVDVDQGKRIKRLNLTDKGKKAADAIQELMWNLGLSSRVPAWERDSK